MAILDETGQTDTITEGWRALKLFTDRREAIRLFSSYLNDDPPRDRILFFYGDGGNGKSLLLRFLREHCCKRLRPENWQYVKTLMDEEFAANIEKAEGAEPIPFALLDFGMEPRGDDRPQDAFSGLLMLRRTLATHGLRSPLFDFAIVWYLHKTNKLTHDRLESLFPVEEMDLIAEIVDAISNTSWAALGRVVLNVFSKHSGERYTLYKQRRKLNEAQVEDIQTMDHESELINELPRLFAEDLNRDMLLDGAPKRIVLFFDTHEAFWGVKEREFSDDPFFQRDEWLRRLLGKLEFKNGIVAVVAGRDQPRWAKASKIKIPKKYTDLQLVGCLSELDAAQYLERALEGTGIADAGMRQHLVAYARVASGQIHPLYLGMCAEVVLAAVRKETTLTSADFQVAPQAAGKGKKRMDKLLRDKGKNLMDKLLRYVDVEVGQAVQALSACRAFDQEIYFKLGEALKFQATEPAFNVLTSFSFVWRAERRGAGWYRIHDLLRRLARDRYKRVACQADEVLEKFYRERGEAGEETALVEAIYHASQLDRERGVKEWLKLFDSALEKSKYELCRALRDVRQEMSVQTLFQGGRLSRCEADYRKSLSQFNEAALGYLDAIDAFDKALERAPEDNEVYNEKALAHINLGDLHFELSQNRKALQSYKMALSVCDAALKRARDDIKAYANKVAALVSIGDLEAELWRSEKAFESYKQALDICDEALQRVPNNVDVLNDKGYAFSGIGQLQAKLSRHEEAVKSNLEAIVAYDEALKHSPDDVVIHNNKAYGFMNIGESQAELGQHIDAIENFNRAIDTFNAVLRLAPDDAIVWSNKARALRWRGLSHVELARHSDAVRSYMDAMAACEEALRRAPEDIWAHNTRGLALLAFGQLQGKLEQEDEAIESYRKSIAAFDKALEHAQEDVESHNGKAYALQSLGQLQLRVRNHDNAIKSLQAALAEFSKSLEIAPDNARICKARDHLKELMNGL